MLLFLIYSFVLLIGSLTLFILDIQGTDLAALLICLDALQLYIFFRVSNKDGLGKNMLRPTYLVLIGMFVVNFQNVINVVLGLGSFDDYIVYKKTTSDLMSPVLYLGIIAQVCLSLGYVFYKNSSKRKVYNISRYKKISTLPYMWILSFAMVGFLLSIDLQSFLTGMDYAGSGAFDVQKNTSAYFEQFITVSIVIISAIKVYNNKIQNTHWTLRQFFRSFSIVFWVIFIVYVLLRLLSGDRGPVIYNLLLMFFCYLSCERKKMNIIVVGIAAFIGISLVNFLGVFRAERGNIAISSRLSSSYDSYDLSKKFSNSCLPMTQELAKSQSCTVIAFNEIETGHQSLGMGKYNIFSIVSGVPGSVQLLKKIPGFDVNDFATGEVITVAAYGKNYRFGLGTSSIAAVYLDLGVFGLLLFFPIFGIIMKIVDSEILGKNKLSIYWLVFALFVSSMSIYIGRASFCGVFAKGIYAVIVFTIVNFIYTLVISNRKKQD